MKKRFQEERRSWKPLGKIQDEPKPLPGKRKGPVPQEQLHHKDRPNTTAPVHEEKGLLCLEKRNQHTEHKTFRLSSEGVVSTPRRCWAAPHWALFGTAGGPTSSPHSMGAIHGGDAGTPAQSVTPMTLSCMQRMSQLSWVREELQHPWIKLELLPRALYPTCTHTSSSHQGPSLCRVLG